MSADDQQHPSPSPQEERKPARVEDILLDRLQNEPKTKEQIARPILFSIVLGVIALGIAIYFIFRKPEKFAENPHENTQAQGDSSAINAKRLQLAPMADSISAVIASNPNDDKAHLALADVYYESSLWQKSRGEFEFYLKRRPDDVDARVDYAYVVAQATGDFSAAVRELDTALTYNPDHLNALFNAGILSIRANMDDKRKGLQMAKSYFTRARSAAKKEGNEKMAKQIDEILKEIEKPVKEEEGE